MTNAPDINSDARGFIAENAAQTAYWAELRAKRRRSVTTAYWRMRPEKLLHTPARSSARRKTCFSLSKGTRDERTLVNIGASRARLARRTGSKGSA
jgi:hypothetical protein